MNLCRLHLTVHTTFKTSSISYKVARASMAGKLMICNGSQLSDARTLVDGDQEGQETEKIRQQAFSMCACNLRIHYDHPNTAPI